MANAVYSNAVAKSRANYMLGAERMSRMIDAESVSEAIKVLGEVGFGGNLADGCDIETIVNAELVALYDFVKSTSPSERFTKFFLIANDYHNAEAYMKAKHLPLNVESFTTFDGLLTKERIKSLVLIDDYAWFSEPMKKALKTCDGMFVSGKATGADISSVFARALYEELYEVSKRDKILFPIYQFRADCANISLALRSRNFAFTKDNMVKGGRLLESELSALCTQPFETLKDVFKAGRNGIEMISAIDDASKNKPLADFEKQVDGFAVKYLQKYKYSIEGVYPFDILLRKTSRNRRRKNNSCV